MKKLILFLLLYIIGSIGIVAQQNTENEYRYPHLRSKYEQHSNWKPAKTLFYTGSGWACDLYYEYDHRGDVIKYTERGNDSIVFFFDKEQAWRKRSNWDDIVDSILFYRKSENGWELYKRRLDKNYDYDSLYYLSIGEVWDGTQWEERATRYYAYYDTSWFAIHFEQTTRGKIDYGYKNSVETNDRGNIVTVISENYNPARKKYVYATKSDYFYDEQDVCYEEYSYSYINDEWQLKRKIEYEWEEWHGFDDGSILWLGSYYDSPTNNRYRWQKRWDYNRQTGEWVASSQEIVEWDIDENGSFTAKLFYKADAGGLFLSSIDTITIDDFGNRKRKIQREFTVPDENGHQEEIYFWEELVESEYGDKGRHRWHSFFSVYPSSDPLQGPNDTMYWERLFIVDSFVDITTLSIDESALQEKIQSIVVIPNPAAGDITIRAEEALQRVEIFDMSGKAVFSKEAIGEKETTCSLGMLPKGIYLIRAQLKNGKIATEKIVLQ